MPEWARSFYQSAMADYEQKDFVGADENAKASEEVVKALENIAQAAMPMPDCTAPAVPPRHPRRPATPARQEPALNRLLRNRLLLQLLFAFLAALSVASLSVVLITQAIQGAERVILGETNKLITNAIAELKQQYSYRVASDPYWNGLPAQARDLSARGITQTVLRSYPGVEGGFYVDNAFLGYAFPTHDAAPEKTDVPRAESGLIRTLAQRSLKEHRATAEVFHGKTDLLVLGAVPGQTVAWRSGP